MLCVAAGATLLSLAATEFTLDWTHSVARTRWWERWQVSEAGLDLREARITGAGAGMEPPPDAVWRNGGWHFTPSLPPQRELLLASSGATVSGWRLCTDAGCHSFDMDGDPLRLWSAPSCAE